MLRYRLEGSGAPLLLIHGWGVTYSIWQRLAPLLKNDFQLVMVELPGLGDSPVVDPHEPYYPACAEAIEEVRLTLGIEQWGVLAYSTGTRVAEVYVQRYYQYINRVVFLCPVYLNELWSLFLHLLHRTYPISLAQWLLSDWRLSGLVRTLGFNGRRHYYNNVWKNEIELQSLDILVRSLSELPGSGRAPFQISQVPTLFLWGSRDVLTARPYHPRYNDVVIPADHSAPMLAAFYVAEVVVPFLKEGKRVASSANQKKLWRVGRERTSTRIEDHIRLLNVIRKASMRRSALLKPEDLQQSSLRKKRSILQILRDDKDKLQRPRQKRRSILQILRDDKDKLQRSRQKKRNILPPLTKTRINGNEEVNRDDEQ